MGELTVYYLPNKYYPERGNQLQRGKTYHYRRNCPAFANSKREIKETTETKAKEMWLEPCDRCKGAVISSGTPSSKKYDDDLLNELSDSPDSQHD